MLTVTQPKVARNEDVTLVLQEWVDSLTRRVNADEVAATTVTAYQIGARRFMDWCIAAGVEEVTPDVIRDWKSSLKKTYKANSINAWLAGVKALFSWAVETKKLTFNPAQNVKGAKRSGTAKQHARATLTDVEVTRILAQPDTSTVEGIRNAAILHLMAYTGMRTIEVHRAELGDLRTENGRLVLYVHGKGHIEADDVVVIASRRTANAVYDWLAKRGNKPGALFTSLSNRSRGERLSLRMLRSLVKKAYKQAGVQNERGNKTTHSLRHTAITKAIMAGAPVQKVKNMARHKSIETTMVYFHEVDRLTNPAEEFINYGE